MKFKDIIQEWFAYKKLLVKESTLSTYYSDWEAIKGYWADQVIEDVRSRHIQAYVNKLLEDKKLSIKTVKDRVIFIKQIIRYVQVTYELPCFSYNLVYPTVNLVAKEEGKKNYDINEQKIIINKALETPTYRNIGIVIALTTGLRIGELCALQFSDVDFERHSIYVRKTIQRIMVAGGKSKIIISNPKTKTSIREVPILPIIEKWLKNASKICREDYYLLSGGEKYIEPRTYRNYFNLFISDHGLSKIKFHGLRHSYASRLVTSNTDIRTVSELLGHSNVSTTLNIYSHSNDKLKRDAALKAFKIV